MTSLASGFAIASNPVLAQAITTNSKGLIAGEVSITVADGKIPAYRAMPAGPGKFPVMLVVQEIFGVHEHIKDMCRRYAKMGYVAIAPEMFARQGDVSRMTDIPAILSQVVSKVPDAQVCADLDATLAFARASGHADAKRTGLVGYCWGGRTAWVYARHNGNAPCNRPTRHAFARQPDSWRAEGRAGRWPCAVASKYARASSKQTDLPVSCNSARRSSELRWNSSSDSDRSTARAMASAMNA